MPISQYLHKKYGFYLSAQVPTGFLCEELLIDEAEVVVLLKEMLPRGQWRLEMIRFSVFCVVVDEVLKGA